MIRFAILGAGKIAAKMAFAVRGLEHKGEEICLYAVASRDPAKAQSFADTWEIPHAFGSYEDMLADPAVDLVYIATPHPFHYPHSMMCLDAGKHVLCEKPFTVNAREAEALFAHAREKGLLITEAIWTRYMPSRQMIDTLVSEMAVGEITTLTANLNYPMLTKERVLSPDLAGGALLDVGIYPLNFASMILGDDIGSTVSVCVKSDRGVDLQNHILLTYKNGVVANLHSSAVSSSDRDGMLYGTSGYIRVVNINNPEKIQVYSKSYELLQELIVPEQINGYEYEVLACMAAIKEGRAECPEMPHQETLVILRQMDALREEWGIRYPFE